MRPLVVLAVFGIALCLLAALAGAAHGQLAPLAYGYAARWDEWLGLSRLRPRR